MTTTFSVEDFQRLARLVSITDPHQRSQRTISEVFTGQELTTIPMGTAHDVEHAFQQARIAQQRWSQRPIEDRCSIIQRYHKLVLAYREFLMDVLQAETGKARCGAQEELLDIVFNAHYYVHHAPQFLASQRVAGMLPGVTKTIVHHRPKGVVGVISPWNYPMTLSLSDAIPALLAGNAVVIKPDSHTPYCTLAHTELLYEAGIPRDLLHVIPGAGSVVGQAIVQHCDYLMFTGSSQTGSALAQQCGQRLIGFSAELGGKNPMIITDGANLKRAAKAATRACFSNAGQLCISIERIYVEKSIFTEFATRFVEQVKKMHLSASYDFHADMGSLISAEQIEKISAHVQDAIDKGATVLTGGRPRPDLGPFFYEPTVLTNVTDEMECAHQETFGPVVTLYPVKDIDEAIRHANNSDYGLNASVWASTKTNGEQIAARLESGTVNVDEGYALAFGSTAAPMGGMKTSGVGRRHGPEGLLKYTESQTISTSRLVNLDPPLGIIPNAVWQKAFFPLVRLTHMLPRKGA